MNLKTDLHIGGGKRAGQPSTLLILLSGLALVAVPSCKSKSDAVKPTAASQAIRPAAISVEGWPFDAQEAAKRQDDTAKALGIPKEITFDLDNKIMLKLVLIPAGKFLMGSPVTEREAVKSAAKKAGLAGLDLSGESPQHVVEITKPFYMGSYHVTKAQFVAFIADSNYKTDAEKDGRAWGWDGTKVRYMAGYSWRKTGFQQDDDHPVVNVSWNDVVAFCAWLGKKTGKTVTLPTEAQFEYANRAGSKAAYPWGDDPDDGKGWCNGPDQTAKKQFPSWAVFSWDDGYVFTSPVGKFKANAFGLYDMTGNAWEWCSDWYDEGYYANSPKTDPQGPATGQYRVLRGGSWGYNPWYCRSAFRPWNVPVNRGDFVGFRVVALPG